MGGGVVNIEIQICWGGSLEEYAGVVGEKIKICGGGWRFFPFRPLRISNGIALTDLALLTDRQTTGRYQIYYIPATWSIKRQLCFLITPEFFLKVDIIYQCTYFS